MKEVIPSVSHFKTHPLLFNIGECRGQRRRRDRFAVMKYWYSKTYLFGKCFNSLRNFEEALSMSHILVIILEFDLFFKHYKLNFTWVSVNQHQNMEPQHFFAKILNSGFTQIMWVSAVRILFKSVVRITFNQNDRNELKT